MHTLYFRNLPLNVARSAFRDAVEKFVVNMYGEGVDAPKPIIDMVILDRPTSEKKHVGFGAIQFADEKTMEMFIARLRPIRQCYSSFYLRTQPTSSKDRRSQSSKSTSTQASKKRDNAQPSAPNRPVMNLNRVKHPQFEKREVRLPNIKYLRKLHHRLSIIGSTCYSRPLVDETGYFIFEDDEKSLRISIGGSHQDSTQPSVAIAIQTINYVALGTDAGKKYMFLALAQNPHFELGDISRPTTGVGKFDVRRSRNRLSALDERHERVAPYTSSRNVSNGWTWRTRDGPPLSFGKLDMYSAHNIAVVEKWFQGGSLDFEVAFQIEALFRNGALVPTELLAIKPIVEKLAKKSKDQAADALRTFRAEIQGAGARKSFNDFEDKNVVEEFEVHVRKSAESMPWEKIGISKASFMCYHVKITHRRALKWFGFRLLSQSIQLTMLIGPLEEQSNRVIRRYPGYETHFIRVAFTDEADGRARFEYEVDTMAFTQKRVGKFLKNAIRLCDREYELLGYSQSGFRENACFFVAPFEWKDEIINGEYIRYSLGNFDKVIDCPARYGARMSQAFSSTSQSTMLQESEIRHIMELKNRRDEMFSDGCGTISRELAKDVWKSMLQHLPPSRQGFHHENELPPPAFQIRIGGSKGMVRLDPKLEGRVLCLRPSMTKFEAEHDLSLEIARAFVTYSPCFLNRPLVVLLWSGGVEDDVFLNLMKDNLAETMSGMTTLGGLRSYSLQIIELGQDGVRTSGLHKLLNATLFHIKRDLKHKSRIKVPDSYTLVGVCDEDDYLRPRQIYACVQHFDQRSGKAEVRYLKGRYLVTRSPVIHPGDAQVVWAIGEPPVDSPFYGEGNNLPNIVVFSSKGPRPIPNMLGGGDLGPIQLDFSSRTHPSLSILPSQLSNPKIEEDRKEQVDVADFMVEYICHDSLGMIATNHLVIASTSDMRARDENCIVNAELHSRAVDFVKTGFYVANHQIRKAKYDKAFDETTGLGLKPDWQAVMVVTPTMVAITLVIATEGNPARESDVEDQVPTTIRNRVAGFVARYKDEIQATVSSPIHESAERVSEVEVMLGTNLEVSSKPDLIERMKSLTRNLTNTIRYQLKSSSPELRHLDDWVDAIKEGDTEIETANTAEEYGNQQNGNARGSGRGRGEEVGTTTGRTRMEAITDTTATVAAMARAKGPTAMDKPMARSGVVGPATELLLPVTFPSEMVSSSGRLIVALVQGYNDENKHVLYSSPPLCFGCCVSNETAPNRV
ncbi:RNA-dependent RNA polymerase [Rhizoctonia solani]|uniref:RNA-dependent RNA polymerase n=1 Tax=Rhizoctonia solani TaxID=456999 RepID=A0A8H7IBZ4_9AGAM|nr:RNA-dependent RNA polymerase [Rhizoctonia solani]